MRWLEVQRTQLLGGEVKILGAKNSVLALIAACCLGNEPIILRNIPDIQDVRVACSIAEDIGVKITRNLNGSITLDPRNIDHANLDVHKTSIYRASYYFIGALLAKFKAVKIGFPGGDDFVSRPIDQHIKGFRALGANIVIHKDHYVINANKLTGTEIYFDVITSGATMNLLFAAVCATGNTVLRNAAKDPEVVDVSNLLNKMGAKIRGAGTDTIKVTGVQQLGGCDYTAIPDRLMAGTFLMIAGISERPITVMDVIPEHMEASLAKLKEIGLEIERGENFITAHQAKDLNSALIQTEMYPGFATDLQQPLTSLLLMANGRSVITDNVYPYRFGHVPELNKMGAGIEISGSSALINGKKQLKGTLVHTTDIRAGLCMIFAGLMADGITRITGVEHLERGVEDVISSFRSIGTNIKLCTDNEAENISERFL
ncbi:UDP-N-acetylglucosamine 1-carboxyvinyltransferase [Paenibacillus tritici]|uniref:UDP-N-acetylglucosamine 1-carboxyvinyltransferase n=1 Tax=Paenibacillus tritici TaxID=1873425 RepID=UPI001BAB733F|nr:UDP-N-acetylglucosamine 1-carboxyvinyltransferase [Paenibacillus tritici]QUL57073.1 UDP-N-acetylglucosamine 1-carboxyvinyltransferase [Paenibacillus tritici]